MERNPLRVSFAGLELENPTILASGVLGYSAESLDRVVRAGAGAVVTKSIGVEPRVGYVNPTLVQAEAGFLNAMGLPNPGIGVYVQEIGHCKTVLRAPLVVSVFGYSAQEYAGVAKKAASAGADAVELNVSCPHVRQTGAEIGQDPKILKEVVENVKAVIDVPLIVKLSPNVSDIALLGRAAVEAGADALTAVNTLKAVAIDVETTRPVLANVKGGLSGAAVKPVALRCVWDIFEELPDVPIIGCGGISSWSDAVEFFLAGASAVQIGSAVAFDEGIFNAVNRGVLSYLRRKHLGSVKELVGLAHRS